MQWLLMHVPWCKRCLYIYFKVRYSIFSETMAYKRTAKTQSYLQQSKCQELCRHIPLKPTKLSPSWSKSWSKSKFRAFVDCQRSLLVVHLLIDRYQNCTRMAAPWLEIFSPEQEGAVGCNPVQILPWYSA